MLGLVQNQLAQVATSQSANFFTTNKPLNQPTTLPTLRLKTKGQYILYYSNLLAHSFACLFACLHHLLIACFACGAALLVICAAHDPSCELVWSLPQLIPSLLGVQTLVAAYSASPTSPSYLTS